MAKVFVSHSSADARLAVEIHGWLVEAGHEAFLDTDAEHGLTVGDDWEQRLHRQLRSADALVCVVTAAFVGSTWCTGEVAIARAQGCRLLPVQLEPTARHPFLESVQHIALTDDGRTRVQLLEALRRIDAGGRSWRSDTSPFPGLRSFDPGQHDVFFGRAAEVNELGALLRSPARRSEAAVQLVVGPSGCGKSSLVRAGLLPVMAEEPGWCTLAPMTPGVDPVGALVRELAAAARGVGIERTLDEVRERLRTDGLSRIVDELLHAAPGPRRDRMLLVVDQFEELLAQAPPHARAEFAAALRPAIAGSLQVVATLRPEFLDQLLVSTELAELATRTFTLRPLLRSALPDVVEGPARLAGMVLDEGLVTRLVADTKGGEALPLLAYTLAELAEGLGRGGLLSTVRYEELGGVRGAVTEQAAAALAEAVRGGRTERQVLDDLLRLVTVDEHGRPTRRRVPRAELPSAVVDALDPFVERRLLVVDSDDDGAVLGVAHEAFLTAWPPLAEAVRANSTGLRARRGIEQAASEWDEAGRPASRLWERGQLAAALADTGARVGRTLVTERVDVSPRGLQFLQLSWRRDRLRRGRSTAVLTVLLVLALTAATVAVVQMRSAAQQQRLATSRFLMTQAQAALADDPRTALQLGEAAQHISPDAESGAQLAHLLRSTPYAGTLPGRTGSIDTAEFSPDGRILATGTEEHTVVLWDVTVPMRARPIGPPLPLTGEVIDLAFSPDGRLLAVRGDDHTVVLWDVTDPERARTLGSPLHHDGSVTAIAFSPDSRSMVTAADDGLAVLWSLGDPAAPAPLRRIKHTGRVYAVAFSPDGRLLATGDSDGLVALWDLRDLARSTPLGQPLRVGGVVDTVVFAPDGRTLVVSGILGGASLWDVADPGRPQQLAPLTEHAAATEFAFSTGGRTLLTVGGDRRVVEWDLTDRSRPRVVRDVLPEHARSRYPIAVSPDGRLLVAGSVDRAAPDFWHLDDPTEPLRTSLEHAASAVSAAFTPSSTVLAVGTGDAVALWDTADPRRPRRFGDPLDGQEGTVFSVAFDPDGRVLATGSADHTVALWDVADPLHPRQWGAPLVGHDAQVATVAFSPDGKTLATGGWDNRVLLWDVSDPARPQRLPQVITEHTNWVNDAVFAPRGALLATAGEDDTLRLWDVSDPSKPRRVGEPLVHPDGVKGVAFAPDGHLLATAVGDDTVLFWDVSDPARPVRLGQPLRVPGYAAAVSFSPDGRTLATGSGNDTVTLWDVTDLDRPQQLVQMANDTPGNAGVLRFTRDGRTLATQDGNEIRLWDLSTLAAVRDESPARACALTGGGLDPEQWARSVPVLPYQESCQAAG